MQSKEMPMPPEVAIGKCFPDLTLPDHKQQLIRLSELANGFPLIVSFYRGYW
jgi:peroxiredoxin